MLPAAIPEPARQRLVGHRGRHGDEHPAAQPARSRRARSLALIDNPDADDRASCASSSRARTSRPAAYIYGRAGHQGLSGDGPRPDRHARARGDRGEGVVEQVADRRHRDPVPGQQREAGRRTSPSWCATRSSRASATCANESDRDGMRIVIELKRDAIPRVVLNQLYKHTHDAVDVRRDHAGAGARRAHAAARAEGHGAQGSARALHHAPPRSHRPARAVRARQGARARAHPRGPQDRRRQHRRGDQDHPRGRRHADRAARSCRSGSSSRERQAEAILNMRLAKLTGLEIEKLEEELKEVRARRSRSCARSSSRSRSA